MKVAAAACNTISQAWCEATNAEALDDLVRNNGVIAAPLNPAIVATLRETNTRLLAEFTAKDPQVKKVHDSFMAFKANHDKWAGVSEAVYQTQIRGGAAG